MSETESGLTLLQTLTGVESDETEEEAVQRGIALWRAESAVRGAIVLVDPIHTVEDIDPELNEGYARVVNVCGNVLVRA